MDIPDNLTANLHLLWPEFLVAGLAFIVLTVDFLLPSHRKITLPTISIAGLIGILVFSLIFLGNKEATPLYQGILLIDRFSLLFTVFFLILGILIVLASVDYVNQHLHHPGEYYGILLFSLLGMMLMAASSELLRLAHLATHSAHIQRHSHLHVSLQYAPRRLHHTKSILPTQRERQFDRTLRQARFPY